MGWIAGTASAAFGFAYVLSTMVVLANGGLYGGGHLFTNAQFLGVLAGMLSIQCSILIAKESSGNIRLYILDCSVTRRVNYII